MESFMDEFGGAMIMIILGVFIIGLAYAGLTGASGEEWLPQFNALFGA